MEITKEHFKTEVLSAYKKLKSYVYHDSFSLDLRLEIAEFEANGDIDKKLDSLADKICNYQNDKSVFDININNIGYRLYPKTIEKTNYENHDNGFYFSNSNTLKTYSVTKEIYFIECDIELHIISILWIIKIGQKLDSELITNCFGNRLERNVEEQYESFGIKLFSKYYVKYNAWRDETIKKAIELHKNNLDVAILNLDIKNYYHSVDYDLSDLKNRFKEDENNWLNEILEKIHFKYKTILNVDKRILPIGLISSSILANYYLSVFDKIVIRDIRPAFYGRYVDDILMVFSNPKIRSNEKSPVGEFINDYLIEGKKWGDNIKIEKGETNEYIIQIGSNKLSFQNSKVKLYHFHSHESIEVLNRFEEEIINNSSEFRFQPEESNILESFNYESYNILYSDTVNKLRSIDGFETNKLGASKHLRKLIDATKNTDSLSEKKLNDISEKVIDYFSGVRSVELYGLWEKAITFFIINKSKEHLIRFTKNQLLIIQNMKCIDDIKKLEDVDKSARLQKALLNHLANTLAISISLNREFFKQYILNRIKSDVSIDTIDSFLTIEEINKKATYLVDSNMFRQQYLYFPLLNYCKQDSDFSFTDKILQIKTNFEIIQSKIDYSPRFIHYHELLLFNNLRIWFNSQKDDSVKVDYKELLDKYISYNKLDANKGYIEKYPSIINDNEFDFIKVNNSQKLDKIKIGLVNIKVDFNDSLNSMKRKPNLSFERLNDINKVLNEALINRCNLVVFPEISIPLQWINIITDFSKKNDIGIIAGIEHFSDNDNIVYNYVATILPFKYLVYQNAFIDFRLKKDYSPSEVEQITGRSKYRLPDKAIRDKDKLRIYDWKRALFSVLNCFELTDIAKRATFRGNVDFLATVEYNRDVNYFSNITESFARDVHSYIIQVNTSNYGDSRITQPSESFKKDLVKIKGGDNVSLITGVINIKELREFQSFESSLQMKSNLFKLTPPNFKILKKRNTE